MTEIIIRPSKHGDISTIHDIYEYEVLCGSATFDENPPSKKDILKKRTAILKRGYPYLVAEVDGKVVAYSYVSV